MKLKNIAIALAAAGLIGIAIGIYFYTKPQKDLTKVEAELKVDAQTLFSEFEEDEEAANHKYLGKVLEVSGEVVYVNKHENGNVSISFVDEMFGVTCTVDSFYAADNQDRISTISKGKKVSFKGKCDGMLSDVVLTQCIPTELE